MYQPQSQTKAQIYQLHQKVIEHMIYSTQMKKVKNLHILINLVIEVIISSVHLNRNSTKNTSKIPEIITNQTIIQKDHLKNLMKMWFR